MIPLTRLSGSVFAINSDLIERIDSTPDTVITLIGGTKYVVSETLGHSTTALTADTYTSVYAEVATEAAERAAALVPRGRAGTSAHTSHAHPSAGKSASGRARRSPATTRGAGRARTDDLTDYESLDARDGG